MKPEQYSECQIDVNGWPVRLTTYKAGDEYRTTADNVSPGANLARTSGATKEDAERKAVEKAQRLLGRTVRRSV